MSYIWEEDDEANLSPEEYWSVEEDMDCPNNVLDEDGERICSCGDEGRLCESCAADEAAYWADQFRITPRSEIDPEAYEHDMKDAGRGHLVKP